MSKLFSAENISKSYDSTKALQNVCFSISKGEVVGLVGENGAGKSTLLKIIMGVAQADEGTMEIEGKPFAPKNPKQANQLGVGMVFQEQSLITNLTVSQNIFFGEEKQFQSGPLINWGKMDTAATEILNKIGLQDIPATKKISDIQFSRRQMVEIAKVLHRASHGRDDGALILLDEPTSVLNGEEIKVLFDRVRALRDSGNGVVFISHRLDEVLEICDSIFVFKDGKNVCQLSREEATEAVLYEKMVGKSSSAEFYRVNKQTVPQEKVLVEAENIGLYGYCKNISFTLNAGEIMGICGVVGSGKENLCAMIAGDEAITSGTLRVNGKIANFSSPNKALKAKILSIPTERRVEGQIGIASIMDNITYSNIEGISKSGLISKKLENEVAEKWIKDLNIKCQGPKQPIENLSGGNAQKVVFARVLSSPADIIILNHPTRGVDVGAKEEIYEIIRSATDAGKGIILLGDTLEECIGLSNKLLVMKDGLVTQVFHADPENKPTQVDIIQYMM